MEKRLCVKNPKTGRYVLVNGRTYYNIPPRSRSKLKRVKLYRPSSQHISQYARYYDTRPQHTCVKCDAALKKLNWTKSLEEVVSQANRANKMEAMAIKNRERAIRSQRVFEKWEKVNRVNYDENQELRGMIRTLNNRHKRKKPLNLPLKIPDNFRGLRTTRLQMGYLEAESIIAK